MLVRYNNADTILSFKCPFSYMKMLVIYCIKFFPWASSLLSFIYFVKYFSILFFTFRFTWVLFISNTLYEIYRNIICISRLTSSLTKMSLKHAYVCRGDDFVLLCICFPLFLIRLTGITCISYIERWPRQIYDSFTYARSGTPGYLLHLGRKQNY
jgi:hypothetical protein